MITTMRHATKMTSSRRWRVGDGCWVADGWRVGDGCWVADGWRVGDGCWVAGFAQALTHAHLGRRPADRPTGVLGHIPDIDRHSDRCVLHTFDNPSPPHQP